MMHGLQKVIKVLKCLISYYLGRCVWATSDFCYISMHFAFREHTTFLFLSLHLSLSLSSQLSLHWHRPSKEKQYGFISALTMMHEPDGKHFSGVVIIKPFFFHRPHVKEIQRQGPECNTLISLKLFIGICGASAAGLSPFQLPDLFNSVGNEKCAALLELRSKKAFALLSLSLSLSRCFSLSFILSSHHSHTCWTGCSEGQCVCYMVVSVCPKSTLTFEHKQSKNTNNAILI